MTAWSWGGGLRAPEQLSCAAPREMQLAPTDAGEALPWTFRVFALGRFQVLKDGAPLACSRRAQARPLELLQALIAHGGMEVGAGVVVDALWPDSEGDAGYHALESTLYRLRLLLGERSAVSMANCKLTLDHRLFWTDVWAFEIEVSGAAGDSEPGQRLARLCDLYRGHFLAHEMERLWAVQKRQLLREKFGRAIREIARTYETCGQWQQAVQAYHRGIEIDSLDEDLHRGLIRCHRELGDHVAALGAYRRCSELLTKLLGIQPSSKTLALYQSVRHAAASQRV